MFWLRNSEKILCAFCKLPRRVYRKTEVSVFDVSILLFLSGLFMFLVWGEPDMRSLILFGILTFSLQVFVRVRWRESLKCRHCGFDPILYKEDSELAADRVKDFLEKRKKNPQYLLRPKPQIEPIIKKTKWSGKALQPVEEEAGELKPPEKRGVDFVL